MNLLKLSKAKSLLLFLFPILSSCEREIPKKTYESIPMAAVLANPEKYAGKKVDLKGYISGAGGVSPLIFLSKQSMLDGQVIDAIHFDMTGLGERKKYWSCDGSSVSISGVLEEVSSIFTIDLVLTRIVEFRVIGGTQGKCPSYKKTEVE